jgi:hypothetical protein
MARKTRPSDEANEYIYIDGETTASAYVGTEQDKVYRSDPDWTPVGQNTPPPEKEGVAEATPHSGKTESENRRPTTEEEAAKASTEEAGPVAPNEHSRTELNELATAAGVDNPEALDNRGAVADAINAARAEAAKASTEEE